MAKKTANDGLHKMKTDVHVGFKISKDTKVKLDKYCKANDAKISIVARYALEKLLG